MFDAKLAVLVAKQQAEDEVAVVMERSDDVGFAFMEIVNARAPSKALEKDLELAQGFANQADALMAGVAKAAQEIQVSEASDRLESAQDDFEFIINGSMSWFDKAAPLFEPMDDANIIQTARDSVEALRARLKAQPSLVDYKIEQLTQAETAREQLSASKAAVEKSVTGLDEVLVSADAQFNRLQAELGDSVSFGFKSTIMILIILLALATQNFNSMRWLFVRR